MDMDQSNSPMKWWSKREGRMQFLSKAARGFFSIPASTSNCERLFSGVGRAVTRHRPNLSECNACGIVFRHANVARGVRGEGNVYIPPVVKVEEGGLSLEEVEIIQAHA